MTWSLGHVQSVLLAEISSQMPEKKKQNKKTKKTKKKQYCSSKCLFNGKT